MSDGIREFGVVGLGRIGGGLAVQAIEKGYRVVGYARHGVPDDLKKAGVQGITALADFRASLSRPRAVFLYVPAGPPVDSVLDELLPHLDSWDVVVDGGNSYWGDSIRRFERLRKREIHFVDLGTSGGVTGARHGACFMAGGEKQALARIEPILKALAVENGYVHAGPPGAGHFVKLVHNGIEFGMLQAIGEGMALLRRHRGVRVVETLACWQHGSVIRSWLIDLMHGQYVKTRDFESIPDLVEDTGEVNWLVDDALRLEVPVPVIAQSVMALLGSRLRDDDAARAVAMMRNAFGGHRYGRSPAIARERQTSRIGPFVPPEMEQPG